MEVSDDKKEELLTKQKKEKKEMQGKIQGLKKTVTKGDKKKKKEVQEAIAKLELELNQKHEAELSQFNIQDKHDEVEEEALKSPENKDGKEEKPEVVKEEKTEDGKEEKIEDGKEEKIEDGKEEKTEDGKEEKTEDGKEEKTEDGKEEKTEDGKEEKMKNGKEEKIKDGKGEKIKDGKEVKRKDGKEEKIKDGKKPGKVTKAQKRRDKKAAEQRERAKHVLEQERQNERGPRRIETEKIKEILKKEGLMICEIKADGNCLYNAVAHQLRTKTNISYAALELREAVSKLMKRNQAEYLPFLWNSETGDIYSDQEYFAYCDKIAKTTAWGGQLELKALSNVLEKPIRVIQADGPILVMGSEHTKGEVLTICYHRHMYKLGEHYNSVQALVTDENTLENTA